MAELSYGEVDHLRSEMIRNRSLYDDRWRVQADFAAPRRYKRNIHLKNDGSRKDQNILNNVAGRALRTFVSGMMNGATSRARPWWKATVTDPRKASLSSSKRWFSQVESVINAHFQIGNLYRVLPMAYKDVGVFSNSAYAMLPHERYGFYFWPFAMGSYAFASDSEGNTNMFTRDFTLSIRQTVEMYATLKPTGHIDWGNIEPWIRQQWEASKYQDTVTLTNLILPNRNPNPNSIYSKDKEYQSYTYVRALGAGLSSQTPAGARTASPTVGQKFLAVKGYDYFPVITPRWEIEPEGDYGVDGPCEMALGDIQSLQRMESDHLEAVAKLVRPPMVGPSRLRHLQASILAGGITYTDESSESGKFRPAFEVDPKLSELVSKEAQYEQAIRSAFYEDLFLMISNERKLSHVTAKEMELREAEALSALGPVLGQLDQDQNGRIIDIAYNILSSQGKIPKPPKELLGEELRPEYISILAQAAKSSMVTAAEKTVNFTSGIANATQNPALLKLLRGEDMVRDYAEWVGLAPERIRDEFEYEQLVQQEQQRQQQIQQQAQLAEGAKAAKDMSAAQVGDSNLLELYARAQEAL